MQELQTAQEQTQAYYLPARPSSGDHLPASPAQPHWHRFTPPAAGQELPTPRLPGQTQAVLRPESRAKQMSSAPEQQENHDRLLPRTAFCSGDVFLKFAHTYKEVLIYSSILWISIQICP